MSSVESELSTDILKKKELFIFEFVAFECKLELKNTTWIAEFNTWKVLYKENRGTYRVVMTYPLPSSIRHSVDGFLSKQRMFACIRRCWSESQDIWQASIQNCQERQHPELSEL